MESGSEIREALYGPDPQPGSEVRATGQDMDIPRGRRESRVEPGSSLSSGDATKYQRTSGCHDRVGRGTRLRRDLLQTVNVASLMSGAGLDLEEYFIEFAQFGCTLTRHTVNMDAIREIHLDKFKSFKQINLTSRVAFAMIEKGRLFLHCIYSKHKVFQQYI